MSIYPRWFRAVRAVARAFARGMEVRGAENVPTPCVLITRHLNNYGPVAVYLYSPVEFHIWSLHMFFDAKETSEHFANYTLPQRARLPKWLARFLARGISAPIAWFFSSQIRAVPVYRGLKSVMKTFDLSADVLEKGENLLIMSDVHYDREGKEIGEIYTGFLHLGKLYYKRTGKRLAFVPMSINRRAAYLRFGSPLLFDPEVPFATEKERLTQALLAELSDDY